MEKTLVSSAVGFVIAILMAIASVELVGIDATLATSLMDAALIVAAGVAGLLVIAIRLESRERSRIRRARVAAATGGEAPQLILPAEPVAPPRVEPVPWPHSPHEVVVAAPAATAWTEDDVELTGVSSRAPATGRPLMVRLIRRAEPSAPRQWFEAVEASDLDGVFLDPRAYDTVGPEEADADLVGHSAAPAATDAPV